MGFTKTGQCPRQTKELRTSASYKSNETLKRTRAAVEVVSDGGLGELELVRMLSSYPATIRNRVSHLTFPNRVLYSAFEAARNSDIFDIPHLNAVYSMLYIRPIFMLVHVVYTSSYSGKRVV